MIEFNVQPHGFSKHISSVTHLKTWPMQEAQTAVHLPTHCVL